MLAVVKRAALEMQAAQAKRRGSCEGGGQKRLATWAQKLNRLEVVMPGQVHYWLERAC